MTEETVTPPENRGEPSPAWKEIHRLRGVLAQERERAERLEAELRGTVQAAEEFKRVAETAVSAEKQRDEARLTLVQERVKLNRTEDERDEAEAERDKARALVDDYAVPEFSSRHYSPKELHDALVARAEAEATSRMHRQQLAECIAARDEALARVERRDKAWEAELERAEAYWSRRGIEQERRATQAEAALARIEKTLDDALQAELPTAEDVERFLLVALSDARAALQLERSTDG